MRYFFVSCFASLLITACTGIESPKEVVKAYLAAIDNLDYGLANQFLIPNEANRQSLDNIRDAGNKMTAAERQAYTSKPKLYNIASENIQGNTATVMATNDQGGYTIGMEFHLEKINGAWLIKDFRTDRG